MQKSNSYFLYSILLIAFLLSNHLFSQYSYSESKRPKIGLVLKGGGALGMAHVGVIGVLEKYRVPVDFVAGTSMGSIVGAAFASGCSVDHMKKVLIETDWDALFGEKIKRQNLDYRMKAGRQRELYGDVKFGFKDGNFTMPQGIVEGQNIRLLFQRLYGDQDTPIKYDNLNIPFRGVAADLETGEAYVPDSGDLSSIVRASMSVPGAFSPVDIDGRLLVDGGIVNNLPIDVVLKMGADILIVVDLQSDLAKRKDLGSVLSISGQMVSLLLAQNSAQSLKLVRPQDVVVTTDVNGYTVTDFPKGAELIAIGEKSAEAVANQLKKLSVSEDEFAQYLAKRTNKKEDKRTVSFVKIKNQSDMSDSRIRQVITQAEGKPLDVQQLEEDITKLYQKGHFTSVSYNLIQENGQNGVEVVANGRSWLDNYVRLGFGIEDNLDGDESFRLGASYRLSEVTTKDSYLESEFEIGKTPLISFELYQPFTEDSKYFIDPKAYLRRNYLNVMQNGDEVGEYSRTEAAASLVVGRSIESLGEVVAGVKRGTGDLSREVGDPDLPEIDYDIGDAVFGLDLDSLDRADFPTSGFRFATVANAADEALGAPNDFQEVTGLISVPMSYGRNTFNVRDSFATTFDDRPIERARSLGGFLGISGYTQGTVIASNYNIGSLVYFRRFSEVANPFFDLAFFAGLSYEASSISNPYENVEDYALINSGSVFFGADTPLLPFYMGYGLNDEDQQSFYIVFGRISGVQ